MFKSLVSLLLLLLLIITTEAEVLGVKVLQGVKHDLSYACWWSSYRRPLFKSGPAVSKQKVACYVPSDLMIRYTLFERFMVLKNNNFFVRSNHWLLSGFTTTNQHELLEVKVFAARRQVHAWMLLLDRIPVRAADDGWTQHEVATGNKFISSTDDSIRNN